ncbi:MAG: hypothetical protein A2804_02075 [Candidatus Pacebacteria bacterium RIFCSPHIGHO2_01_FULL_46_10]|nr:MAG: hypothetical protein A2804_02075 [Candidatus Pacebacteria bacterium RIFCSPHIGHO2_01_FULL_46_10]
METHVHEIARSLFSLIPPDIGIDLGTANTVVYVRGRGVVFQEPSVVARSRKTRDILAVGSEAKRMIGKAPHAIEVIRPLRNGVIADLEAAEAMLDVYIHRICDTYPLSFLTKPKVVIGIPSGITEVERRAVQSAAVGSGAGQAWLIEEPMAAAVGAGLNVLEPEGRMVVDIGGGTTEIAVISLGGIVLSKSLHMAGDALDETVASFVRTRYGVIIGETTAEQTKIAIGSAYPFEQGQAEEDGGVKIKGVLEKRKRSEAKQMAEKKATEKLMYQHVVRGRDVESGLPRSVKVQSGELREALSSVIQQIITGVMETLEETPPELVADILKHGIVLAGGSAQLRGLEERLAEESHMPVWTATEPYLAVARGCGIALENPALLKHIRVSGKFV